MFVEKRGCGFCALTLEPPYRTSRDALTGRRTGWMEVETLLEGPGAEENFEVFEAGRATKLGRIWSLLSLRCLKLIYLKRYVGGLVQFDGSDVCISTLLGFKSMIECQLHCLAASGNFGY